MFGEQVDRFALLGSSYTAAASGQVFPKALEYYSGSQVVDYSFGGGAATAMVAFLEDEMHNDPSLTNVVWVPATVAQSEMTTGAALLGAGLISGGCHADDDFFARRTISVSYDEWIELPEIIGLADRLDVFADKNEQIEFDITMHGEQEFRVSTFLVVVRMLMNRMSGALGFR